MALPGDNTDDPRWQHIVSRNPAADETFWYSVKTTGVYCRPSCPSKTPNPKNVRFHGTLESARATGYRPCMRCTPEGPSLTHRHAALVVEACRLIEAGEEEPSLAELADTLGVSPGHLHRLFKHSTGLTPKAYATAHRAKKTREALRHAPSITEAYFDAGFNSSGRFYEQSTAMLGMKPSQFRAGGANEQLIFAVGETSLGSILVASSARGVAAILMGDEPEALLRDLQDRFPNARLTGADPDYETLVAQVVGLIEAPGLGHDLPLDVRGTAFQQRVWQALSRIPAGQTVSYAELAKRIGSPKAIRAVAGACAANPLAVAIPCHRVVRTNGALAGYAWGIERKQRLLERESGQDTNTATPR